MDAKVERLFKLGFQIQRSLAKRMDGQEKIILGQGKMLANQVKAMRDLEKWLKMHEVRLTEHWKHIRG